MNCLLIKYLAPRINASSVMWKGELHCPGRERAEVYFDFTCPDPELFTPFVRPFLLAFLIPAMRIGLPIQLEQPLDQTTLQNLMEWQEAMAKWFPTKLKVVPIRCDIAPSGFMDNGSRTSALTAFSGGVDSCFTAYRHTQTAAKSAFRHTVLGAGLMVHGFDIPLTQQETFQSAFNRSVNILTPLGLKAYEMRSNVRCLESAFGCDWEYETHGIWLAAALSCLEPYFHRTLIPASYPYQSLIQPWASNPALDPLFASDANDLWHDGASHNKLDKVRAIAHHPAIQQNLRVCWEGARMDRNCGQCAKCVMTQICLWVSGVQDPPCFERTCNRASVETLKHDRYFSYLSKIIRKEATRQNMAPLARQLEKAARRARREAIWHQIKHPRQTNQPT